jgi:hypothetical protein
VTCSSQILSVHICFPSVELFLKNIQEQGFRFKKNSEVLNFWFADKSNTVLISAIRISLSEQDCSPSVAN